MRVALFISRVITVIGFILALVIIVDFALPATKSKSVILAVKAGFERSKRTSYLTHYNVSTSNRVPFPIYIADRKEYAVGDSVLVSTSMLLGKHTELTSIDESYATSPCLGIYSYFSALVPLLLFSTLMGMFYWRRTNKQITTGFFTLFLGSVVWFLCAYYA